MSGDKSMPPRKQSDLTIPIDRSLLPPISVRDLSDMGVDTDAPEVKALIEERAVRQARREAVTLEECPCCKTCALCKGAHVVEPEIAAAYSREHAPVTK